MTSLSALNRIRNRPINEVTCLRYFPKPQVTMNASSAFVKEVPLYSVGSLRRLSASSFMALQFFKLTFCPLVLCIPGRKGSFSPFSFNYDSLINPTILLPCASVLLFGIQHINLLLSYIVNIRKLIGKFSQIIYELSLIVILSF